VEIENVMTNKKLDYKNKCISHVDRMNRDIQILEICDKLHKDWNRMSRRHVEDTIRQLRQKFFFSLTMMILLTLSSTPQ
jgi:hypothetical protein